MAGLVLQHYRAPDRLVRRRWKADNKTTIDACVRPPSGPTATRRIPPDQVRPPSSVTAVWMPERRTTSAIDSSPRQNAANVRQPSGVATAA
jgi:hypothetical protein